MRTAVLLISIVIFTGCGGTRSVAGRTVSKQASANPKDLEGKWRLEFINDSSIQNLETLFPAARPDIVFETGTPRVSGSTGCNQFSGAIRVDGSNLVFDGAFVMTKRACPGDGERIFLDALRKTNAWVLTDPSTLNLIAGNLPHLRFTKID